MATSSSKNKNQQKPSQTAQILEHVEMLLALYESQDESASGGIGELLDKQAVEIENRFKRLDDKIENISSSILGQVATASPEGGTDVAELLDNKSVEITCAIESQIEKRFANFESKIDKLSKSLGKQKNNAPLDISQLDSLAAQTAQEVTSSLESLFGKRLGEFESKLESVNGTSADSAGLTESQLDLRFDAINVQFEKIAESITEQGLVLESLSEQPSNDSTDSFAEKTNAVADSFNAKIESMFEELGSRVARISQGISQQETVIATVPEPATEEEEHFDATTDSASHWHRQKEAMLSKYGIDPEYRPLMELPNPASVAVVADEPIAPAATTTLSEEDSNEIEAIKEQLNARLREAEVELSISRANISRQKANMEAAQVELDRRATAIEEKYAAVMGAPKKRAGFLERLGRHLGKKKPE